MIIFKSAKETSNYLREIAKANGKTGFVPTMGALHKGHLSLVEESRRSNDTTVCSIFVNPSQFNDPDDFLKYPVTVEKDIELLVDSGTDVLFLPSVEEVYPAGYQPQHFDLGDLEQILEGKYRPGHFQGVCQVVNRLLDITNPDQLYLGRKDYQQCLVIKKLTTMRNREKPLITISDTMREPDGLAMSSRNRRLTREQRKKAGVIFETLEYIRENFSNTALRDLKNEATSRLVSAGFAVDYVAIADAHSLLPAIDKEKDMVVLIAATIGDIRLIDNMQLSKSFF